MIRHQWILNVRDQLRSIGFNCGYSKDAIDKALLTREERDKLRSLIYEAVNYIETCLENVK